MASLPLRSSGHPSVSGAGVITTAGGLQPRLEYKEEEATWELVTRCLSPSLGCEVTETLTEAFGAAFLIDMCFRILQRNRSLRGDLLWESTPKIMEAKKSHDARSAGWRTGKAGGIIQSSSKFSPIQSRS